MSGPVVRRSVRSASDPATSVLAVAEDYRARLQRFFNTPERTVDLDSLADFLCLTEGAEKRADARPARERLETGLATVRFCRPAAQPASLVDEAALLETALAQSDHQNMITARFMALLGRQEKL